MEDEEETATAEVEAEEVVEEEEETEAAASASAFFAALRLSRWDFGGMEKEKGKWKRNLKLLEAFEERTKHQAREHTVLAFDIQVENINVDNQSNVIKEIYQQNSQLQSQIEIV